MDILLVRVIRTVLNAMDRQTERPESEADSMVGL